MAVTLHFITENWEYNQYPIGFRQIIGQHTALAVGNFVANVLLPFLGMPYRARLVSAILID